MANEAFARVIGLMHLVRPDLFDPERDPLEQLSQLSKVMIRNNKATVTDLQGQKLFKPVNVFSREYQYSDEETQFYTTLSVAYPAVPGSSICSG